MKEGYELFKIPPDFDLVKLHDQASYPYLQSSKQIQMCLCCEKYKKEEKIPYCEGTETLIQFGQEVPMLFYFLKATSVFLLFIVLAKIGDFYLCNLIEQNQCSVIYAQFDIPQVGKYQIPAGFKQTNQALSFGQFFVFIVSVIALKVFIKMKKYKIKQMTEKLISNRTLKLINVHKRCTAQEIKEALKPYKVQVVLTYKVRQLQECLININKLLKMKKMKHDNTGSFIEQSLFDLDVKIRQQKGTLQRIKRQLKQQNNRLSIAFVIFTSNAQKQQAQMELKTSLPSRLFYKFCTCCSDTSIRGQSFTIKLADDPGDIIWKNLQNPYLRTKFRRLVSIFVCVFLLAFGVATQYLFIEIVDQNSILGPIIKSAIVLVLNYFIVTFLDYSTEHMQFYESHTQRHLTLVRKMTAFLFINISLSPLLGYYFSLQNKQVKEESIKSALFANFCFSVLVLTIGNITKPFPMWLSVDRIMRAFSKWMQKRKEDRCILTQIQANKQFQPIEFPISTFYSLYLSSFLMVCFYINTFQSLILVELVSLIIMYWVSKWMLLRVCKAPVGLARRISNLAQSFLRIAIFVYWLGKVILTFINLNEDKKNQYEGFFGYIIRNAFGYLQLILAVVSSLFLQYFVSWFSSFALGKMRELKGSSILQSTERLIKNNNNIIGEKLQSTYANANLHLKLQQQCIKFEEFEFLVDQKEKEILKKQKKIFR